VAGKTLGDDINRFAAGEGGEPPEDLLDLFDARIVSHTVAPSGFDDTLPDASVPYDRKALHCRTTPVGEIQSEHTVPRRYATVAALVATYMYIPPLTAITCPVT
jgi:hypothetical protein